MNYASLDHVAAVADTIAFDSELISIGGHNVRAHIEIVQSSMESSEFGIDNREEILNATLIKRDFEPDFGMEVKRKGKIYRISEIDPASERIVTLTLTND
jgi:hypothetical protein